MTEKPNTYYGTCMECYFEATLDGFEKEYEYDPFYGREYTFFICPICNGGVELTKIETDKL